MFPSVTSLIVRKSHTDIDDMGEITRYETKTKYEKPQNTNIVEMYLIIVFHMVFPYILGWIRQSVYKKTKPMQFLLRNDLWNINNNSVYQTHSQIDNCFFLDFPWPTLNENRSHSSNHFN